MATGLHTGNATAQEGWITLSGGRNTGVMHEGSRGARQAGGLTLGILPGESRQQMSEYVVDISVITGMGSARNNINVLTADVVVACGLGAGKVSEIALALKAGKHEILLGWEADSVKFFRKLKAQAVVYQAKSVAEVIQLIHRSLQPEKN